MFQNNFKKTSFSTRNNFGQPIFMEEEWSWKIYIYYYLVSIVHVEVLKHENNWKIFIFFKIIVTLIIWKIEISHRES